MQVPTSPAPSRLRELRAAGWRVAAVRNGWFTYTSPQGYQGGKWSTRARAWAEAAFDAEFLASRA